MRRGKIFLSETYGSGSAGTHRRLMRLWIHSDGHRRNILDPRLRKIGIGVHTGTWKDHRKPAYTPPTSAPNDVESGIMKWELGV